VELISPQHTAKELVHTLRQGQIASLFQKSVRRVSLPFMHPQHAQVDNLFIQVYTVSRLHFLIRLFLLYRKNSSVENGKVNSLKSSRRSEGGCRFHRFYVKRNYRGLSVFVPSVSRTFRIQREERDNKKQNVRLTLSNSPTGGQSPKRTTAKFLSPAR